MHFSLRKSAMKISQILVVCCLALSTSVSCLGQTAWSEADYTGVTEKLSSDLLASEKLRDYIQKLGKKPNVSVGLIRSEVDNNVDVNELIRRF
jgi:hypothetical protein